MPSPQQSAGRSWSCSSAGATSVLAHRGTRTWCSPSTLSRSRFSAGLVVRSPISPEPDGSPTPSSVVTRKWLATLVTAEETATQVEVVFTEALDSEGLWPAVEARQADRARRGDDSDEEPILLAMSDNGPQMRAGTTREFLALCCIAARFGRPGTPTDQAWIETLFGHIKTEWPHLEKITDPNTLRADLDMTTTPAAWSLGT